MTFITMAQPSWRGRSLTKAIKIAGCYLLCMSRGRLGPLFEAGSLKIRELAKINPVMAYELTKAANSLQAYAADQPYILRSAKNRAIMDSAVAMLRTAAETGAEPHLQMAKALANFFTGQSLDAKMTVVEENGVRKFAAGSSLNEVIRSPGGEQKVAQAVYHELASNLSWMNGAGAAPMVQREWGRAYSVEQAMTNFLKPGMQNPTGWVNSAKQSYRLAAPPSLRLVSPDVQAAYNDAAAVTTSPLPAGQQAMNGAFSAFKIADDIIKAGDTETGKQWLKYGRIAADVGLGFVPGVGLGFDAYSVVTGYNLITGDKLSKNEQIFAAASMLTLGYGSRAYKAYKGLRIAAEAGHFTPVLNKAIHKFERVSADDLNKILRESLGYTEDSWNVGGAAWKLKLAEPSAGQFSRLHLKKDIPFGNWIVETRLIAGKTGDEIQKLMRLPFTPKFVSDVSMETGDSLIRGTLNFRAFENSVEKVYRQIGSRTLELKPQPRTQYFLENFTKDNFKNTRELP